jgi:hypothetical protein
MPSLSSFDTLAADPTQLQLNINPQDTRVEQEEQLNMLLHNLYGFPLSETALPSNEGTSKRGCNQVNYDLAVLKAWVVDDAESHINHWITRIGNSVEALLLEAKKVLNCMPLFYILFITSNYFTYRTTTRIHRAVAIIIPTPLALAAAAAAAVLFDQQML